ncbi:MAG: hypothetical protein A3G59_00430 [Candidatus Taylorbacteria bacterium RIFCSPLOWO2_12_FULL_47_20]|uniref:Uncharacterized protein n=2 Tax=Candidatus Tayloriibacteriota TaxID=1817919 RepID=A0A1G2P9P0_9BACT|nr:MAG: hypothetical protein A3H68_03405 [Candidatus Taylorbacteria bacterium RIFCSPLOWO2_02_FULL_46_40]OHA45038.1 MAG: hypothetical protein A3G59_00430 [Candidatus Taylorbacteria bacterium RIFCSPLOWO2_12_FULL_47_20]
MKKRGKAQVVFLVCVVLILAASGYFIFFANSQSNISSASNTFESSLDEYEAIIEKYEKQGFRTENDVLQFGAEVKFWSIRWQKLTASAPASEVRSLESRLDKLNRRVQELIRP